MAISVLDVRDTFAPPRVRVPAAASAAAPPRPGDRVGAGLVAVLEAVGLLAAALTGLDGVLRSARPGGWLVAAGLVVLAGWIVLCAGSGAALIDGTGRRTLLASPSPRPRWCGPARRRRRSPAVATPTLGLPLPAVVLLALAVPVGKLLLVGAPPPSGGSRRGPAPASRRPDPVTRTGCWPP